MIHTWINRFTCRVFGHKYEDRIAIQWRSIGTVLVWEPVDVEICARCGVFRRYYRRGPPPPVHVNCRCGLTGIPEERMI